VKIDARHRGEPDSGAAGGAERDGPQRDLELHQGGPGKNRREQHELSSVSWKKKVI